MDKKGIVTAFLLAAGLLDNLLPAVVGVFVVYLPLLVLAIVNISKKGMMPAAIAALKTEMEKEKEYLKAIHAGLECGLLSAKITDLDCVSIGPDMRDIHTTEEKLSISSTKRVWEFVVEVVSRK